ncbi:MAG: hypothetical protein Q8R59_02150, partial [Polaromonas sp.]|nr:hypothetical protein [Polaromonas sp.]
LPQVGGARHHFMLKQQVVVAQEVAVVFQARLFVQFAPNACAEGISRAASYGEGATAFGMPVLPQV